MIVVFIVFEEIGSFQHIILNIIKERGYNFTKSQLIPFKNNRAQVNATKIEQFYIIHVK